METKAWFRKGKTATAPVGAKRMRAARSIVAILAVLATLSFGAAPVLAQDGAASRDSRTSAAEVTPERVRSAAGAGTHITFGGVWGFSDASCAVWCYFNQRYRNSPVAASGPVTSITNNTDCTLIVGSWVGVGEGNSNYQEIAPGDTLVAADVPPDGWPEFDYYYFRCP